MVIHGFDIEKLYALKDFGEKNGYIEVSTLEKAKELNEQGYGIFWNLNKFDGPKRASNCVEVRCWIADLDDGTKEEQWERIHQLPLKPSMVTETKKGYHCYWVAENATVEKYRAIEEGLVERLQADKHCTDLGRLLRVPNFLHQKDVFSPFLVRIVYQNDRVYPEDKMFFVYEKKRPVYTHTEYNGDKEDMIKEENIDKIFKPSQILEGGRNSTLCRYALWLRDEGFSRDIVENTLLRINAKSPRPLDEWEVRNILKGKF